jgi:hypothetical protein
MGLRVEPHVAGHKSAGLPQPEEVFLCWLMAQPEGADLAAAADVEIGRLGRYAGRYPGPRKLAGLFRDFRHCLDADPAAPSPRQGACRERLAREALHAGGVEPPGRSGYDSRS